MKQTWDRYQNNKDCECRRVCKTPKLVKKEYNYMF